MSYGRYNGGGGRRNRYRGTTRLDQISWHELLINEKKNIILLVDDYDDRIGREVYETPEQKLKTTIIRFGDVVSITH